MAEHGHGGGHEHAAAHAGHAEHGGGHAEHGGHGKEKKAGFFKTVAKQLRGVFTIAALFSLSLFVSEGIAKDVMFETARGAITTPATLAGSAISDIELTGGGHASGSHAHGASHGHAHGAGH